MKSYLNISLFLLTTTFFACGGSTINKKNTPIEAVHKENVVEISETQLKNSEIAWGGTVEKVLSGILKVNGVLDVPSQNRASVSAKIGGFIKSINLQQGSTVVQGQLLAVIENQAFIGLQQAYLEAQSRTTYLQAEYERQKQLSAENVNAQKVFQQVSADYYALQAQIKGLEAQLSMVNLDLAYLRKGNIVHTYNVYAPASGIITAIHAHLGKFVQPQDALLDISNTSMMRVVLNLFEQDIAKIQVGQTVRFTLINQPQKEYTAKVYLINAQVNQDRSMRVECQIESKIPHLAPNAYLKASVELDKTTVQALPDEAFVQEAGKDYVFVFSKTATEPSGAHEGHNHATGEKHTDKTPKKVAIFEMVEVKKGVQEDGFTEVSFIEKPKNTPQIVTKGALLLLAQLKNASGEEQGHAH